MKRCPYCKELNGESRTTCFKCRKPFPSNPWQNMSARTWVDKDKPQWRDIVLKTWDEHGELRLKEHSLSVKLSGRNTEIPLGQIVSITIAKEPSSRLLPGMIEIRIAGCSDMIVKLTSFLSVGSGNVINFPHGVNYKNEAYKLRKYIMEYQAKPATGAQETSPTSATASAADEIKKFKELLDIGAITQDEFEQKKKQLLDL